MTKNSIILDQLRNYMPFDAVEASMKSMFIEFLEKYENSMDQSLTYGHVTGSAWIVDADFKYALLTHHRRLDKWLQLGGHCEDETLVKDVAFREALEECGLTSLKLISSEIFSLDVHKIPAITNFPEHFHFDLRFLFTADRNEPIKVSAESKEVRWIELDRISNYNVDAALQRMVNKTTAFQK